MSAINQRNKQSKSKLINGPQFDDKIKILILGDTGVGKTALIHKYMCDKFQQTYTSTIGIDFKQKIIKHNDNNIKIQIWDTAGQQRFHTITQAYYRGSQVLIIAFSLTQPQSFQHLSYWLQHISQGTSQQCLKVLVGTKCDLQQQRSVSQIQIAAIQQKLGMIYYEVSSKTGQNVIWLFQDIYEKVLNDKRYRKKQIVPSQNIKLTNTKIDRKKNCQC